MNTSTEAVKALLDAASPGPWHKDNFGFLRGSDGKPVSTFGLGLGFASEGWPEAIGNAALMQASRELVPALLAERDAAVARAEAAERREVELRQSLVAAMNDHAALFAAQNKWMQKTEDAKDRLQAAEAEAQRMREALAVYACTCASVSEGCVFGPERECGWTARAALHTEGEG